MAPERYRLYRSSCRNPFAIDPVEDELATDSSSAESPHLDRTSPAPSLNPTPGPDLVSALVSAPISAPVLTNELFKKFMKAYLETNQESRQSLAGWKQTLKAKVLEVYYGKSNMDCYHFCQQCTDHFQTAGDTEFNQTPFTAAFLHGNISVY